MATRRSEARAWLPALLAPLVMIGLLLAAWALNKASLGGDSTPKKADAPLWRWLVEANNAMWGSAPFATTDHGRPVIATIASIVTILVIGYLGTWRGIAGLRAGSSAWPAFLSTWMVLIVASVAGIAVWWLIAVHNTGAPAAGQTEFAVWTNGLQYGAKFGWLAALLSTLVWMLIRPAANDRPGAGTLGPPTPYPQAREDFFRRQQPNAPQAAPTHDDAEAARIAAIRAQVDAEAAGETAPAPSAATRPNPFEPRPNPAPASLLDQHRQTPIDAPSPFEPSVQAEQSVPSVPPDPEPTVEAPYVGRRARAAYDPEQDVPDRDAPREASGEVPAPAPYGSHRGPSTEE